MTDKTYEMLWDCEYCGTKKLLGKTHRHCPSCGAPQNPETRYFPEEDEKVAVEDHVFAGADLACPACEFPNARAAKHCGRCGSPMEEGAEVARRADEVGAFASEAAAGDSAPRPAAAPSAGSAAAGGGDAPSGGRSKRPLFLILGGLLAVVLVAGLLGRASTSEAVFRVAGHAWKREVAVERLERVRESEWCDRLPAGAEVVDKRREVRSHKKVQAGEDCRTRKVDNGDGTYREKRECRPKYRQEKVYGQRCTFLVDRWRRARVAAAEGEGLGEAPRWPEVNLARRGTTVGSEREGARTERYAVRLVDTESGEKTECEFDEARWRGFAKDSEWAGKVRLLGGLSCSSLQRR